MYAMHVLFLFIVSLKNLVEQLEVLNHLVKFVVENLIKLHVPDQ